MTGAIEFLTKAKAIQNKCEETDGDKCDKCIIGDLCEALAKNETADLVRKVMGYEIKEDGDNEESNN